MAQANLSYVIRPYHKSKGKERAGVNEGGGGEPAVGNSLHSPPGQLASWKHRHTECS